MFTISNLNFYDLVMLLGAMQGIILSLLLYFKNANDRKANQYLVLLMVTFSVHLLHQLGFDTGLFNRYPFLHIIPYSYLYFIGPALYFYVKTMVSPQNSVKSRNWLHFLPALYILPALGFYYLFLGNAEKAQKILFFKTINFTEEYLVFIAVIIYLIAAFRITVRVHQWQKGLTLSKTTLHTLQWIKQLTWTLCITIIGWKAYHLINIHILGNHLSMSDHYPFYIGLAVLIYWLGFNGYVHNPAFLGDYKPAIKLQFESVPKGLIAKLDYKNSPWQEVDQQSKDAYTDLNCPTIHDQLAKVGLDLFKAKKILEDISLNLETKQLYKNNHISLQSFSTEVGYSTRVVSAVVNTLLNKNFNDYINEYRVKEVLHRIKMRDFSHLTILGIAQESGFSSKSTFNRIFKEVTGKTPKDYKRFIELK